MNWKHNGIIFILGKRENKLRKVYISRIITVLHRKKNDIEIQTAKLHNDLFHVIENEGKLEAKRISSTPENLLMKLGLNSEYVVLNPSKTPFWRDTASEEDLQKILKDFYHPIHNLPNIDL